MRHSALYAAFDRVPSAKGAAIHIAHAVRALERIAAMERRCLAEADHILTPSATLARNLERICTDMGVASARITVIPNGADLPPPELRRPKGAPKRYFLYFGALQPWQGVGAARRC